MKYFVYILECADKTLYTGWTIDIDKRVMAHNELKTGAKYTSMRRPVRLLYSEKCESKSQATKREIEIKKMNRIGKLRVVNSNN
jgi:putative endonuclease